MNEDTLCFMTGKKKLKDEYKDPDVLGRSINLIWQEQWRPLKNILDCIMAL